MQGPELDRRVRRSGLGGGRGVVVGLRVLELRAVVSAKDLGLKVPDCQCVGNHG